METKPVIETKISTQVSFARPDTTVAPATDVVIAESSPITGQITMITLHFPDGCNALVEIVCYLNQEQILPLSRFIALNNATKDFAIHRSVSKKDNLRVRITNRDAINPHTPSIIFNLEGIP